MTTPPPTLEGKLGHKTLTVTEKCLVETDKNRVLIALTAGENFTETPSPFGIEEQSPAARRLAWILKNAGEELLDAATQIDTGYMYELAREIASRVLAVCPLE